MKVNLICSDYKKQILIELLSARDIAIDEHAELCIVEAGFSPPPDKLCLLFHSDDIFTMMDLLGGFTGKNDEFHKIIGRSENERYKIIPYQQINYFESQGNYTYCNTSEGTYRVKEKLYEIENKVPQDRFIRVGKSFIINIANVTEITPWFGRRLLLKFLNSKNAVEVSRNYVKNFKEFLGI
jgi:two-component system LytT family response regulator